MNTQSGEIIHNPTSEQIEKRNLVQVNAADVQYLQDIPEEFRGVAWKNWIDTGVYKKPLSTMERARLRTFFFDAFMSALDACGKM